MLSFEVIIFRIHQMVYVSRKEHFNAAHKLFNPEWSIEKNEEVFGACANANWHGHNFNLIVTVKGIPDPNTGFVINLKTLGKIIKEHIIEKVDHKNLNEQVDFFKGKMVSCEIMAMEFWRILERELSKINSSAKLHCIELHETNKNYVTYYGEE